ncbi:dephospho-CoA kinase [Marinomonas sp. SBI22]|uniref:dephospho-CoA kinase n=1 Tax=unclassified Marinomonas TaxID=196814 RepID=UPI0007AF8199|nr:MULTISPECIES: dephospho-CoA kinase [unclassified Marinomonas]KZM38721.1 dephospho-CoA kinase [Marinomonas sp. SBI22]KZM39376.1 dephospho-CoA kinase [Marinomonas sp. SBI8L]
MTEESKKIVVGLAGGIGSGKSTISKLFNELGIISIDADDVAREVVEPGSKCLKAITERYGESILLENKQLDRRQLRQIVFEDKAEKQWLESVTHPEIHNRIEELIFAADSKYALLVHPLLFETEQNKRCDYVIAISVPREVQVQRVTARDNCTEELANKIIDNQISDMRRSELANTIIKNTGNISDLNAKVDELNQFIINNFNEN